MAKNNRIEEDMLEFDDDVKCYNGVPFTGIGFEKYPNGNLKSETPYEDGFQSGTSREWYSTGQTMCELEWKKGARFSKRKCWYQNGVVKSVSNYEWGIELNYKEYNEKGELVTDRELDPNSPDSQYAVLLKFRQVYGEQE